MKASALIYTRTYYKDFDFLYKLSGADAFNEEIEALVEQMKDDDKPQWICRRNNGYALWGILCNNSCLSEACEDEHGRAVRGFFGMVLKTDALKVEFTEDLDRIKTLYEDLVTKEWKSRIYEEKEYEFDYPCKIIEDKTMANISDYKDFLDNRNQEKEAKREAELEKIRKEQERLEATRRREEYLLQHLPDWKAEFDSCLTLLDYQRYVAIHKNDDSNPYVANAESMIKQLQHNSGPNPKPNPDNNLYKILLGVAAVLLAIVVIGPKVADLFKLYFTSDGIKTTAIDTKEIDKTPEEPEVQTTGKNWQNEEQKRKEEEEREQQERAEHTYTYTYRTGIGNYSGEYEEVNYGYYNDIEIYLKGEEIEVDGFRGEYVGFCDGFHPQGPVGPLYRVGGIYYLISTPFVWVSAEYPNRQTSYFTVYGR